VNGVRSSPAIAAGALSAAVAGGVMAALTASAGGLQASLPAVVTLTAALLGGGLLFGWLIHTERLRAGFGPGIVFWIAAWPAARLVQEALVAGGGGEAGLSQGVAGFLMYQAMVGGAFGLGFVLLHSQIAMLLNRVGRDSAR
jgi:hypothetical protein